MRRPLVAMLFGIGILLAAAPAFAQTPDSFTPAVEEACTKYEGEGARHGLCIAYCEAQDCENTKDSNPSCSSIEERFVSYSVRQGYVKAPKKGPAIDCKATACTSDDAQFCGGKERDCMAKDGMCQSSCSATFLGLVDKQPVCLVAPACQNCAAEIPPKP